MTVAVYRNERFNTTAVPLARRRPGYAPRCEYCGADLRPKGGRPPKFCDSACRKRAFRTRNWNGQWGTTGAGTKRPRRPLKSKADFKRFCRPNPPSIVGPKAVVETEIVAGRSWESVTSPTA